MTALTRNQTLVLDRLRRERRPLGAYALLDALRGSGLKAPPQVYRALDALVERGLVHRLETLNAFVACCHDHDRPTAGGHSQALFAICDSCKRADEIADPKLANALDSIAVARGFTLDRSAVELHGVCDRCRSRDAEGGRDSPVG